MSSIHQVFSIAELFEPILHYLSPKELAELRLVSRHWDNFITSSNTAVRQAMHLEAVPRHEYIIWDRNLFYAMSGYMYMDNQLLNLEQHDPSPTTERPSNAWPRIYRSTVEAPTNGSKRVLARLHDFFTLTSMYERHERPRAPFPAAEDHLVFFLPPGMVNLPLAHSVLESFVTQPPASSMSLVLRYKSDGDRILRHFPMETFTPLLHLDIPGLGFSFKYGIYQWGADRDTFWYGCTLEKDSGMTVGDVITFLRAYALAASVAGPSKLIEIEGDIDSHFPYDSVWVAGARNEVGGRVVVDEGVLEKVSESEWRLVRFENFHRDMEEKHVKRWEEQRRIALANGTAWPSPGLLASSVTSYSEAVWG